MKKSIIFITILLIALCSFSCVFAANESNNIGNDIRTTVDSAGNVVEDAAKGTAGAIKNGLDTVENKTKDAANNVKDSGNNAVEGMQDAGNAMVDGAENVGNDISNGMQNVEDNMENGEDRVNRNDDYTATRTATQGGNNNGNGVMDNAWTWIIIAIITVAIIGVIWYYVSRNNDL